MTVAGETQACNAIVAALKATYAAEGFLVEHDKLHRSMGDHKTVLGVYCNGVRHQGHNALVAGMEIVVQFYGHYNLEVKRDQRVDPTPIHEYAERFRQYLKGHLVDPQTSAAWYFLLQKTDYPDDPTGRKTRYEMTFTCYGENTAYPESGP